MPQTAPHRLEVDIAEIDMILDHTRTSPLTDEERRKLQAVVETLEFLTQELGRKHASIERLKKLLFGAATETTRQVMEKALGKASETAAPAEKEAPAPREKAKGHGRNGAAKYWGAEKVTVPHESLKAGDGCPDCHKGTVCRYPEPSLLIRLRGRPPVDGTVYELERLRCNRCGEYFTASSPPGVGDKMYDASSASMIALLKYGTGLPFYRLDKLQAGLGIPLPASTQWDVVADAATDLKPAFEALIHKAAQGSVLHNDDTTMKILTWTDAARVSEEAGQENREGRTGIFTSGVVSVFEERKIALFFTGWKHAGENLTEVIKQRAERLGPPIQMCDALSRNVPKGMETVLANCLVHGRRQFVDVADDFPDECLHVLDIFKGVYRNDARAREEKMTPEERLRLHQSESGPRMEGLKGWCLAQLAEHKVEPNSGLGEAIRYMLKHWEPLTLFLRVPGAPLDNNICERALKKAILHRKNSYFYKTQHGAYVGDLFMSLIHTCELCGASPFGYLTELLDHASEVAAHPENWMPWNYADTLARTCAPVTGSG